MGRTVVPRTGPQPSLRRLYCLWRYQRARRQVRAVYREWAKLNNARYCAFAVLKAEQKAHYWKKKLQELED